MAIGVGQDPAERDGVAIAERYPACPDPPAHGQLFGGQRQELLMSARRQRFR